MYKGLFFLFLSTLFWGVPQPLLFNEIKHISPIEIVCHRSIWSFSLLLIGIVFIGKFRKFTNIFRNKIVIFSLLITTILIGTNWLFFILAISLERLQDASLGYYISPIISIALGYFFLKEKLNLANFFSIMLMITSILLLILNYGDIPYIAIIIGLTWGSYGLIRKKIEIDAEIGLLFETGLIAIISLPYIITIFLNGNGYFIYSGTIDTSLLLLSGLFTIMPLFFFNIGVKHLQLGITGAIFFLTPTFHFLISVFVFREEISNIKIISFIIIWLAVIIFMREKFKENKDTIENNTQLLN